MGFPMAAPSVRDGSQPSACTPVKWEQAGPTTQGLWLTAKVLGAVWVQRQDQLCICGSHGHSSHGGSHCCEHARVLSSPQSCY